MLNSPIRWVGGKSRLRKKIIALIPEHQCYVELFLGAGWVLFGKEPSRVEIVNDVDQDIVNFFEVAKNKPEELIASFDLELVSRARFNMHVAQDASLLSDVERAHRFYYLIMAGWGGELHFPRFQTAINDSGGGNRLMGALNTLRSRIDPVHIRLRNVLIECLDWEKCFERYDRVGTLMYVDPPYPNNGCNYVHNMRSWEAHEKLAARLNGSNCQWIYSSYDTPEVRALFPGRYITPVQSSSGMAEKKEGVTRVMNNEILVTNFEPPQDAQAKRRQHCIDDAV